MSVLGRCQQPVPYLGTGIAFEIENIHTELRVGKNIQVAQSCIGGLKTYQFCIYCFHTTEITQEVKKQCKELTGLQNFFDYFPE
jgi:hypothetical protein